MALVAETQVRMWMKQDNMMAADNWAQAHMTDSIDNLDAAGEIEQIVVAGVFAAQEKFNQALNLLTPLLDAAQAARRMESVLKILILQALIYQAQQKTDSALSVLERVLALTESEGYLRIFIDHGKPMERLLRSALTRGISPNYVAWLLEQSEAGPEPLQALVDPLSERETDVLRLIVAGLSNPEIAEELTIAESTVKTHINHIYGKLSVTSRTQAAAKARELKLL
jgi:LuxR family maltose regulon positive regulatory protein